MIRLKAWLAAAVLPALAGLAAAGGQAPFGLWALSLFGFAALIWHVAGADGWTKSTDGAISGFAGFFARATVFLGFFTGSTGLRARNTAFFALREGVLVLPERLIFNYASDFSSVFPTSLVFPTGRKPTLVFLSPP